LGIKQTKESRLIAPILNNSHLVTQPIKMSSSSAANQNAGFALVHQLGDYTKYNLFSVMI